MILMPFFQKAKIKSNEEIHFIMLNTTTMITISNSHEMYLTLGDDDRWVRVCIAFAPLT